MISEKRYGKARNLKAKIFTPILLRIMIVILLLLVGSATMLISDAQAGSTETKIFQYCNASIRLRIIPTFGKVGALRNSLTLNNFNLKLNLNSNSKSGEPFRFKMTL